MNIISNFLAAWLAAVLAALAGLGGGPAPEPAPDPVPVVAVAEQAPEPAPAAVEQPAPVAEPVVDWDPTADLLAESEAIAGHLRDEDSNMDTGEGADEARMVVVYCAPHITADPALSVQFGCADALIQ